MCRHHVRRRCVCPATGLGGIIVEGSTGGVVWKSTRLARPPPRNRALSGRPADVAFPAAERRRGGPAGTVASYHPPGQPARPTTARTVGPISVPRPGSRCAHRSLYRTDEITDT